MIDYMVRIRYSDVVPTYRDIGFVWTASVLYFLSGFTGSCQIFGTRIWIVAIVTMPCKLSWQAPSILVYIIWSLFGAIVLNIRYPMYVFIFAGRTWVVAAQPRGFYCSSLFLKWSASSWAQSLFSLYGI